MRHTGRSNCFLGFRSRDLESHLILEVEEVGVQVLHTGGGAVVLARIEVRVADQSTVAWVERDLEQDINFVPEFAIARRVICIVRVHHYVERSRFLVQHEVVIPKQQFDFLAEEWRDELSIDVMQVAATKQVHETVVLVSQRKQVIESVSATKRIVATGRVVVPEPNGWFPVLGQGDLTS